MDTKEKTTGQDTCWRGQTKRKQRGGGKMEKRDKNVGIDGEEKRK